MNSLVENEIKNFIAGKTVKSRKILSKAFNMCCEKILLENGNSFVLKYYKNKNNEFNSIISEANSLNYLSKILPALTPSIKFKSENLIITNYIEHNNIRKDDFQIILAKEVLKIHTISNDKYGFDIDAQIGGLKQANEYNINWVDFFLNNRLNMIVEKINKIETMPNSINIKIKKLMINIGNYLPKNPNISLLHGDLWEGNILFNDGELVGLIDPGIYFGHHELEIAYLTWFKLIDNKFINFYSNTLKIDEYFYKYEPIYQLYFSLLNVYLWDRDFYLKDVNNLLNKIFKHKD